MTQPSEAEIEAAAKIIFAALYGGEAWDNPLWVIMRDNSREIARAALTAAAQVRERERAADVNKSAITAMNFDKAAQIEDARGNDRAADLLRLAASRIRQLSGLMPIYGATEPDDGPDVLGERKTEK